MDSDNSHVCHNSHVFSPLRNVVIKFREMNWLACFNSWPARAKTRKIYLKRSLNGRFNNLPCTFCLSPQFDSSEKEVRLKWKGNEMWMTIMKTMATVNSKLIYRLLEKKLNFPCFAWELTHFFFPCDADWKLRFALFSVWNFPVSKFI